MRRPAPYYPNFRVELIVIDSSIDAWTESSAAEWGRHIDHVHDVRAQTGAMFWTNGMTLCVLARLEAVVP